MEAVTEEERQKLVVEGAIASVTGYVAPMEEGQVDAEEVVIFEGEREDVMDEEAGSGHWQPEGDITNLMQRGLSVTFGQRLDQLLKELEAMPKAKAARLSRFLEQMLVDYKRPSPHLRHPRLVERQHRLTALLSVFAEDEVELRGDERNWCHNAWQNLLVHLEDLKPGVDEDIPDVPRPSSSSIVEVVDSQEAAQQDGSRVPVVMQENGTTRPLNDEEERQIQESELWEEEAAYQLRKEDEQLWDEFQASELHTWETWMVNSGQMPQGVKRARVQVLVGRVAGSSRERTGCLACARASSCHTTSTSTRPRTATRRTRSTRQRHPPRTRRHRLCQRAVKGLHVWIPYQ